MSSVYVIAEVGSTHDESTGKMYDSVAHAARAGADAIKFQYWSSPTRMRERRRVNDHKAYARGSIKSFKLLANHAHEVGLDFLCTCYLPEDIEIVAPYVDKFKVSSFEALDTEFITAHAKYGKEIIISTGMFDERQGGLIEARYLHCVSAYPVPIDQANVGATLGYDGYSDHTRNVLTGALAVALGASIIEVHFRLDSTFKTCADYPVSLSPAELVQYIDNVRLAERLTGNGIKQRQPCEQENVVHRVTG